MFTRAMAAARFGAGRGMQLEILTLMSFDNLGGSETSVTHQARLQSNAMYTEHVTRKSEKYRAPVLRVLARMISPTSVTHSEPIICHVRSFLISA
jgi:hypothetical protein